MTVERIGSGLSEARHNIRRCNAIKPCISKNQIKIQLADHTSKIFIVKIVAFLPLTILERFEQATIQRLALTKYGYFTVIRKLQGCQVRVSTVTI